MCSGGIFASTVAQFNTWLIRQRWTEMHSHHACLMVAWMTESILTLRICVTAAATIITTTVPTCQKRMQPLWHGKKNKYLCQGVPRPIELPVYQRSSFLWHYQQFLCCLRPTIPGRWYHIMPTRHRGNMWPAIYQLKFPLNRVLTRIRPDYWTVLDFQSSHNPVRNISCTTLVSWFTGIPRSSLSWGGRNLWLFSESRDASLAWRRCCTCHGASYDNTNTLEIQFYYQEGIYRRRMTCHACVGGPLVWNGSCTSSLMVIFLHGGYRALYGASIISVQGDSGTAVDTLGTKE